MILTKNGKIINQQSDELINLEGETDGIDRSSEISEH